MQRLCPVIKSFHGGKTTLLGFLGGRSKGRSSDGARSRYGSMGRTHTFLCCCCCGWFIFFGVGNSFRTLISSSLSKKDRQEWTEAARFTVVEAWEHLSRGKNMVKVDRVGWAPRTDGVVVLSWQAWPTPCLQNKLLSCRTTRWNIFQNC